MKFDGIFTHSLKNEKKTIQQSYVQCVYWMKYIFLADIRNEIIALEEKKTIKVRSFRKS